jgi:hypothetical protein
MNKKRCLYMLRPMEAALKNNNVSKDTLTQKDVDIIRLTAIIFIEKSDDWDNALDFSVKVFRARANLPRLDRMFDKYVDFNCLWDDCLCYDRSAFYNCGRMDSSDGFKIAGCDYYRCEHQNE